MRGWWKWAAAAAAVAATVVASVAVAAPSGRGSDSDGDRRGDVRRAAPARHLSALAKELGVSTADLRAALEATRDELRPPRPPDFDEGERPRRPSRADMEKRCTELTDALAKELDKSGDDVRAAIKKVAKAQVEQAVEDDRLSKSRGESMIKRIDAADCLPLFPHHGGHGMKCGPRPSGPGDEMAPGAFRDNGSGRGAAPIAIPLEAAPAA